MEATQNQKIDGRVVDGTGDAASQDIGGWIMMPPDHWELIKKKLDGNSPMPKDAPK